MANSEGAKVAPKGKRRWWQFSLASLLLIMTVVALCLGFWADSARRQKRAVQWIEDQGGISSYSSEIQRSPTHKPSPPGPGWLREWLGIDYLDHVEVAHIKEPVTDADLVTFARDLPRLKHLHIEQATSVSDAGFAELVKGVPHLTYLRIEHGQNITDIGLAHLAGLHELEFLHLDCPQMTDAGLAHIEKLHRLESTYLQSDHITDVGLAHLRPLKRLYRLQLNCPIADAGMEHLMGHSGLLRLFCLGPPSDPARMKVASALGEYSTVEFIDEPLGGICNFYTDFHQIKFRIDEEALAATGLDRATPITAEADGICLAEVLDLILHPHGLGWYVGEGEIVITTAEIDAEKHAGINKLRETLPKLKRVTISW